MKQTIYRLGAELLSFRRFLEKHPDAAALHAALQEMTSAVDISGHRPYAPERDDDRFIAEIALGLIARGWPTISSPYVEEALLSRLEPDSGFSIAAGPKHEVTWQLQATPDRDTEWVETFAQALLPIDARLRPWEDNLLFLSDSDVEKDFYFNVLPVVLGPLHACVEWQRPLESMVEDPEKRKGVIAQIADFTIELPEADADIATLRLNLEVDGFQHEEWGQENKDWLRDAVLKKADWHVERIKAHDVSTAWKPPEGLCELLQKHPVARAGRSTGEANLHNPIPVTDLLLAPHAVARIQLAGLLALRDGRLSLGSKEWFVLVREREVSAAWLALADLQQMLGHLCALYELPVPPDIALTIVEDHPLRHEVPEDLGCGEAGCSLLVDYQPLQSLRPLDYDLAIDVSVLCRPTQYYGDETPNNGWIRLRTALRSTGAETLTWSKPREIRSPLEKEDALTYFLQYAFRKQEFRPGQLPIIERALKRKSVIGLLPTGAGKSLTYQLPALLTPGITFVVDPIKSLMQDQVDNLDGVGITSALTINSDQSAKEKASNERRFGAGAVRFGFISPERLQIPGFRDTLRELCHRNPMAFSVLDEAHCVSEWGHDFRTAYLNLGRHVRDFLQFEGVAPPIVALTGTASRLVLTDVQREIGVHDPGAVIEPDTFDRTELHYMILRVPSTDKQMTVREVLSVLPGYLTQKGFRCEPDDLTSGTIGGIVFCPHANGGYGVYSVYQNLSAIGAWNGQVGFYSGGEPTDFPGDSEAWIKHKSETQRRFKRDELSLLTATSAFGMGIDKPNIRYTIHLGAPKSIEAMVQEMGRAGRDRDPAMCIMIFSDHIPADKADPLHQDIDGKISVEQAKAWMEEIGKDQADDACRMLYLHTTGYHGAKREALDISLYYQKYVEPFWKAIEKSESPEALEAHEPEIKTFLKQEAEKRLKEAKKAGHQVQKPRGGRIEDPIFNPGIVTDFDRVVYRLTLLGIVTDYTVNYGTNLDARHNLATAPISEESILKNLETYVLRYRNAEYWGVIHEKYSTAEGDHIERAINVLCDFVYDEIESRRRESIRNIRQTLRESQDGEQLRQRLSEFFDRSIFRPLVFDLLTRSSDARTWREITNAVANTSDAGQLLGQSRRALESDPDHAGLRLLSGLAQAASDMPNPALSAESLLLGFRSEHRLHPERIGDMIDMALSELRRLAPEQFEPVIAEAVTSREWEGLEAPEVVEELAIAVLPSIMQSSTRRDCARTIARRLERECAIDVKQASATMREILDTWHKAALGQIDSEVRDVLHQFGPRDVQQRSSNLAYYRFAFESYRQVQDDELKLACATPILQELHREVQQVF